MCVCERACVKHKPVRVLKPLFIHGYNAGCGSPVSRHPNGATQTAGHCARPRYSLKIQRPLHCVLSVLSTAVLCNIMLLMLCRMWITLLLLEWIWRGRWSLFRTSSPSWKSSTMRWDTLLQLPFPETKFCFKRRLMTDKCI